MNRLLMLHVLTCSVLVTCPLALADNLQLTLDLRNNSRLSAVSGGTWQLFARVVDTGDGVDGGAGIAGVRALLDSIDVTGITFNPAVNPNGAATVQALPGDAEGTVEIVYQQDLTQPTLPGVGVPPVGFPNRDVLIASGSWFPGLRPVFGNDGENLSSGEFLSEGGTAAVSADNILSSVFTLGDLNGSGTITSLDTGQFIGMFPPTPRLAYSPAGDINQSGHISNLDIGGYIQILTGPLVFNVVPEPGAIGMVMLSLVVSIACSRRPLY